MSPSTFNCRRCGHCCLTLVDAYQGCVSDADLERWTRENRNDLLAGVQTLDLGRGNLLHTAWHDPLTGEEVERCPWLAELPDTAGYHCTIEAIKPDHCRDYPEHQGHATMTGCPGYDSLPEKSRPSLFPAP